MYYVGFDVGGSNLKCGITNESAELIYSDICKIATYYSDQDFLIKLLEMIEIGCKQLGIMKDEIASIGLAVPGAVDIHKGTIVYACNLPYRNIHVRKFFKKNLSCSVYLENDANCAALAEYYLGSGSNSKRFITVTLGTGVGGGIIHNGKIFHGGNGFAGEVGHMTIVHNGIACACGNKGCWEQYSSAPALKRMTNDKIIQYPHSVLSHVVKENNGHISGKSAFLAAKMGDPIGEMVCREYLEYLSTGILNLINIFQPDIIAIGGGISNESDEQLYIPLNKMVMERLMPVHLNQTTKIVRATLGNNAGMIGAALLGKKKRV